MSKLKILLFTIVCFSTNLFSQGINTGLPFLKLGADARSSSMGDAFTSVINDHSSFYYNPATIRFSNRQISLSHRQGFAETTLEYIGATIPGDDVTLAFSAYTSSVNDIEVRLRPGDAEGTFAARNGAITVGSAISLTDDLSIGLTGKLLYEKIYIDEASGYGFDGGVIYKAADHLNVGASLSNLGRMGVMRTERTELPTNMRVGASYTTLFSNEFSFLVAGDIVKTLKDDGTHLHLGAETIYDSMFMVRAGYETGYETRSFAAGVGFLYGIIRLDYAFVPMTGAFAPNHTISFSFTL